MRAINNLLNLFHRKQRFNPQYATLSTFKKLVFYGLTGFTVALGLSKFMMADLQFAFQPTEENKLTIKLIPALDRGYYHPNMLMLSGIFQRLYAQFIQEEPYLRINEQQYEGQTLHWVELHDKAFSLPQKKKKKQIPLILVISGSQGLDNTVTRLLQSVYTLGYQTIAVNPKDLFDQEKLGKLISHLKQKYPQSQIFGIGVEYGANLLINFAANNPDAFKGLVSIASEIRLENSWLWRPLYNSILRHRIEKGAALNKNFNKSKTYSLSDVDQYIYGIDEDKYLSWKIKNSSINYISKIKQPSLFIQSKQDPFTLSVNGEKFENQKCLYVTTQRGGHTEWFQNMWMERWFLSPVKSYIKLLHQEKVNKIQKRNRKQTQKPQS